MVTTAILFFAIINGYFALDYPYDYGPKLCESPDSITMDFIIVGGGSAGLTLAACLSEVPEWNVLVLEAGRDAPHEFTENPLMWTNNFKQPWDWNFKTEKCDNMYKGMHEEQFTMAEGRMLGGSSRCNAMIYLRGFYDDFEYWENNGGHGWGYDNVTYYFKKVEDFVDNRRFNPEIHSQKGQLTVSPLETLDPAYNVIIKAERSLNITLISDFNIKQPFVGYGNVDTTTRKGRRCSTLKAFLLPVRNRKNLFVAKNILVTRIVLNGNTAVGVEFLIPSNNYFKIVYCTKEVLLSAGPVKSSQLLMLSGIGPRDQLNKFDIPIIKQLNVGYNLMDHVSLPALAFTDRKNRPKTEIKKESEYHIKEEMSFFPRNIATLGLSKLMTFYKSNKNLKSPDLQFIKFRIPFNSSNKTPNKKNIMSNMFGYSNDVAKYFEDLNKESDLLIVIPILLKPLSTGRVKLNSNDPLDQPLICACYLRHQEEIEALLKGIEFVVKLSKTDEMKNAGLVLENLKLKQCIDYKYGTRDHWLCILRILAVPFFHSVGSNKMGFKDDCNSVVDYRLKVIGIDRLRVIDSSIMTKIVSVNTNAATIMIATKGCHMIKNSYGIPVDKPKPFV